MVISTDSTTFKMVDSHNLKFGMDRILAQDTTKARNTDTTPPCAGCISSLFRCCRRAQSSDNSTFYPPGALHAPQPLRPFSNVVLQTDGRSPVSNQSTVPGGTSKRKRSWSRAVFSNLQRKGLEKRFQLQKYITKPDRRQLAATLGLTDAQVKVWFQNRRMKWRHAKETLRQSNSNQEPNAMNAPSSEQGRFTDGESSDVDVQTVDL